MESHKNLTDKNDTLEESADIMVETASPQLNGTLLETANKTALPSVSEISLDLSSSTKAAGLPIERLKVNGIGGNHLAKLSTPPAMESSDSESIAVPASTVKPPAIVKRYEFLRRNASRGDKSQSPTFVIEGKRVHYKNNCTGIENLGIPQSMEKDNDFDTISFIENRNNHKILKPSASGTNSKGKTSGEAIPNQVASSKSSSNSSAAVQLPLLYIEGPGAAHQLRAKSTGASLNDEAPIDIYDTNAPDSFTHDTSWPDLFESIDYKNHRSVKKNNFMIPPAPRSVDDFSDLCVESTSHKSKMITLQLQTTNPENHNKHSASISGFPVVPPRHSRSPRERLYRSATQLSPTKPAFTSINSYLNFKNRLGLYSSDQYLDSNQFDGVLKPLENRQRSLQKKPVAKFSDMEIQKDLKEFFTIRPAK